MQWINVKSHKAETNWVNLSTHSPKTVHSHLVTTENRETWGFGFISKPLKRVIFLADLSRIYFPEKEMTATSTALGSGARLEQANYKKLNLFIEKHCYSTVIGVKGTHQDSRMPRLNAN